MPDLPPFNSTMLRTRVSLTSIGELWSYTVPLERAVRVAVEEWDGERQRKARITFPDGSFSDLYLDQIQLLYEELG